MEKKDLIRLIELLVPDNDTRERVLSAIWYYSKRSDIAGDEPVNVTFFEDGKMNASGLTIRQHFAAMAMQGYMASRYTPHQDCEHIAEYCVRCADALIVELNKPL